MASKPTSSATTAERPETTQALKTAYEAAVKLFDWIKIPSFNFSSNQADYIALLAIYHEQYTEEANLRQTVDRYADDLRAERTALRVENEALKCEVNTLRFKLIESHEGSDHETDLRVDLLQARISKPAMFQSQIAVTQQQTEHKLLSELSTLKLKLFQASKMIEELQTTILDCNSKAKDLESKNMELEDLQPLVQIGSDIRLRCLEKSRLKLEGCARNQLASTVIEKGNSAAHHGYGDADSALLYSALLPRHLKIKYSQIFVKMYSYNVSAWRSLPWKLKEALNCVATLNCLEAFGRLPNAAACTPVMDHVEYIRKKYDKSTANDFEVDEEVPRRLVFARSLTEQILKIERSSKPASVGRNPRSSAYRRERY